MSTDRTPGRDEASGLEVFPVEGLHRIGVVVPEIEAYAGHYAELFGIDEWRVANLTQDRLSHCTSHGRSVEHDYRTATGENADGTLRFELVQPLRGESIFAEQLATAGPGIHYLQLAVADPDEYRAIEQFFAQRNIGVAQSDVVDGTVGAVWFDTRIALGGYLLKVLVAHDAKTEVMSDDRWDLADTYQRPDDRPALDVAGVQHFGIAVHDVMTTIARYADTYGLQRWMMVNWQTKPGWLERPTYNGAPVDHAYFCGMAFDFHGFGFELVQPTFGPSHYKEDFLQLRGEGVHHMNLVYLSSEDDWRSLESWMGTLGVGTCMSGGLRNDAGRFYYLDTRLLLGGYVVECFGVNPGYGPDSFPPDFVIDHSRGRSAFDPERVSAT